MAGNTLKVTVIDTTNSFCRIGSTPFDLTKCTCCNISAKVSMATNKYSVVIIIV